MDHASARILEIGDHDYFKEQYPERTTLLWTGSRPSRNLRRDAYADCSVGRFLAETRAARDGAYDVVVAYATNQSPWHPRYWLRSLARSPLDPVTALTRVFGVWLLGFRALGVPLVILDMQDGFTINRSNHRLMDRAKLYFKRELPVDHWHVFHGTAHPSLPTLRIRSRARWLSRLAKLRPISVGLWVLSSPEGWRRITRKESAVLTEDPDAAAPLAVDRIFEAKTADIFFSGSVERSSTLRPAGLEQLRALAKRGFVVDLPAERLPKDEYYRRMSQAWLTWSPEGLGWDCYRHYEACQCLSVPVINYPTIIRHRPLDEGRHAVYYAPEGEGLMRAVEAALADKAKLKRMAVAARDHVLRRHSPAAFCDRVLRAALEPDSRLKPARLET
jgi:hypothetical protein